MCLTMTDISGFTPQLGGQLDGQGIELILQAVKTRQENFPDEPLEMTLSLILLHIGARFDPLRCEGKEWRGLKKDILPGIGEPTCPNGHALVKERGLTIGWVINME